jgi:hypothetical protein
LRFISVRMGSFDAYVKRLHAAASAVVPVLRGPLAG